MRKQNALRVNDLTSRLSAPAHPTNKPTRHPILHKLHKVGQRARTWTGLVQGFPYSPSSTHFSPCLTVLRYTLALGTVCGTGRGASDKPSKNTTLAKSYSNAHLQMPLCLFRSAIHCVTSHGRKPLCFARRFLRLRACASQA